MVEQRGPWLTPGAPPPGWQPPGWRSPVAPQPVTPPPWARQPSGLFPGGPVRPSYREPHPIGAGGLLAGLGGGLLWMGLFGMIGHELLGYAWWTLLGALIAWTVAVVLTFLGDRGVAVGVAISAGLGWAVAAGVVVLRWIETNNWPMW